MRRTMTVPHAMSDSEDDSSPDLIDMQDQPPSHAGESLQPQPIMDGISRASLDSLCTSISHRAISSIDTVDKVIDSAAHKGLARLHGMLSSLNTAFLQVSNTLAGFDPRSSPCVLSARLQAEMHRSLSACDTGLAAIEKRILQRLDASNAAAVADKGFLAPLYDFVDSHIRMFEYLQKVLLKKSGRDQDASLDERGTAVLSEAQNTVRFICETTEPLSPEAALSPGIASPRYDGAGAPPPYDPSAGAPPPAFPGEDSSSSSSTAIPEPSSDSQTGRFSWAQSFKAFTASLRPKPDPMVSALCQATLRGDEVQIAGLVSQGANVNGRNEDGKSPLQCAIEKDRDVAAQQLIDLGADWKSSTGWWGNTPPALFQAASAGSTRVALVLIKKGARVDERSVSGQPYFADVVSSGNVEGVHFLLAHGASAQTTSVSGRPVLGTAVKQNNIEMARALLHHGADPNGSDISGGSMLAMASDKEDLTMAHLLLEFGAKPNSRTLTGVTVLAEAVSKRRLDYAKKLLESGADANAKDWYSQTVLVCVVRDSKLTMDQKVDMARLLLEHGASPNASDYAWGRPLISHVMDMSSDDDGNDGSSSGRRELLALLLRHGAKSNKVTMSNGETPLLYALDRGDRAAALLLLEHGASARAKDKKGRTPLMVALLRRDRDLVQLLMQHGADPEMVSEVSPADVAKALGDADLLRILGMNGEAASAEEAQKAARREDS